MKKRFFKDNFNGRAFWGWDAEGYVTSDSKEIEHFLGLGLRNEDVTEEAKKAGRPKKDK